MKTMLLAAAAALSLGVGSAYAQSGSQAGYVYPDQVFPGAVYGGAPVAPPVAMTTQDGQAVHAYATHSESQGTWLFPPNMTGGGN